MQTISKRVNTSLFGRFPPRAWIASRARTMYQHAMKSAGSIEKAEARP